MKLFEKVLTNTKRICLMPYALCPKISMLYALLSMLLILPSAKSDDFSPFFDDGFNDNFEIPSLSFSDSFSPISNDFGDYDMFSDTFADETITVSDDLDLLVPSNVTLNPNTSYVDVSSMDIAGIMLGMTFEQVYTKFQKTGTLYQFRPRNSIVYSISRDWKNNLDYECRQNNIFAPTALSNCINTLARARGLLYASELHLVRTSTGEVITVYFTSNATNNVVWRVIYENDVGDLPGDAQKFTDIREKKILAFWQGVIDKYNHPNSGTDRWISSDNTFDPMLTVYYGRLELTDLGINAHDATENFRVSRENFRAKPYSF